MADLIRFAVDGPVGTIALNRPDKKHALCQAMWDEMPNLLDAADQHADVKVIVLTSTTADAFCAGADIEEFAACSPEKAWRDKNQAAIERVQTQLARTRKPTIAQVSGVCVGGGCGLALACDLRVVSATARFGITPAKLGLVYPLHDTKLLVDLVGPSQARLMLFTGQLMGAEDALRIGLVDSVVPQEHLHGAVQQLALQIASVSQHSVRSCKAIIRMIADGASMDTDDTRQMFNDAFAGPDFQEGVAAFLAKRRPDFPVR